MRALRFEHWIPACAGMTDREGGALHLYFTLTPAPNPFAPNANPRFFGKDIPVPSDRAYSPPHPVRTDGPDLSSDDGRPLATPAAPPEPWFPTFVGMTTERVVDLALDSRLRGNDVVGENTISQTAAPTTGFAGPPPPLRRGGCRLVHRRQNRQRPGIAPGPLQ